MACDCGQYIDCGDKSLEAATYDESCDFSHSYTRTATTDDVLEFVHKTIRSFSVSYGWDRAIDPGYVLAGCAEDYFKCDSSANAIPSATCSESCLIEKKVPYYWDRLRGIYLWKHIREELVFSVTSGKSAAFKVKWGIFRGNKICIPDSVRTVGVERFIMLKDGVQKVLAEVEYSYNPFPQNDIQGGNWGLYGNVVNNASSPDTADVSCILVFPTPPKLAMCQDNDCLYYGFYDYNAVEGGFVENSLPKDDGGKDYFYPYWCRQMPSDDLWRATADLRYKVIYAGSKAETGGSVSAGLNLEGTTSWTPPTPTVYPWPIGSLALDSKEQFVASLVLQFGDHAGGQGIVHNESNIGDLLTAIKAGGAPLNGRYSALFPVTPL